VSVVVVLATTVVRRDTWYVPFFLRSDGIDADDSPENVPNPPFQDPSEENATTVVREVIRLAFAGFLMLTKLTVSLESATNPEYQDHSVVNATTVVKLVIR
jgi:hypothetical protein